MSSQKREAVCCFRANTLHETDTTWSNPTKDDIANSEVPDSYTEIRVELTLKTLNEKTQLNNE